MPQFARCRRAAPERAAHRRAGAPGRRPAGRLARRLPLRHALDQGRGPRRLGAQSGPRLRALRLFRPRRIRAASFEDGTISRWLEDTLAVLDGFVAEPPILVGSSMGGWLALLATRELLRAPARARPGRPRADRACGRFHRAADVGRFPEDVRARDRDARASYLRPSVYSDEPYPITRALIEDGRKHLLFGEPIAHRLPGPHPAGHAGPRRAVAARHASSSSTCRATTSR